MENTGYSKYGKDVENGFKNLDEIRNRSGRYFKISIIVLASLVGLLIAIVVAKGV